MAKNKKHVPITRTCGNCKFWEKCKTEPLMGRCVRSKQEITEMHSHKEGIVIRGSLDQLIVLFGKQFGCRYFKKKQK